MDLVALLRNEGYSSIAFFLEGQTYNLSLAEGEDISPLFNLLSKEAYKVEYYPYEVKPYVMCKQTMRKVKIYLYK